MRDPVRRLRRAIDAAQAALADDTGSMTPVAPVAAPWIEATVDLDLWGPAPSVQRLWDRLRAVRDIDAVHPDQLHRLATHIEMTQNRTDA